MPFNDGSDDQIVFDCYDTIEVNNFFDFDPQYYYNHNHNLNIIHMNIRSIRKHFDEFICYLNNSKTKFHIIVLTESWISHDSEFNFNLENYNVISQSNKYTKSDGLCLFIDKDIDYEVIEVTLDSINAIGISCLIDDKSTKLIAVYRSPSQNINSYLTSLDLYLQGLSHTNDNLILLGDSNLNILENNTLTNEYLTILHLNGLKSFINTPTRVQNYPDGVTQSVSCIDHIFFKSRTIKENDVMGAVLKTAITDHYCIAFHIKIKNSVKNKAIMSDFIKKTNYDELKSNLKQENWNDIYCNNSEIDTLMNTFINKLADYLNAHTKIIKIPHKSKPLKKWITLGMLNSLRKRDKMHKKLVKQPFNTKLKKDYKTYRNTLNNILKTAKIEYFDNQFELNKNNPKKTWENINQLLDKEKIVPETKIAPDILNNYFVNVGSKYAKKILNDSTDIGIPISSITPSVNSIFLNPTNIHEISSIIKELKINSSPGIDNLNASFLKKIGDYILKPLEYLINRCFNEGHFPNKLKIAKLIPIHKSGDKGLPENYRPISLLSNFAKIIEKILKKRIVNFLTIKNFIHKNQYGFQPGKSTTDTLLDLTSIINNNFNKNNKTLTIFIDLAKAFDTIPHKILLHKLNECGIRGQLNKLLENYLSDRTQVLTLNNTTSIRKSTNFGLPQGTVLSPILFIIYVNDLLHLNIPKGTILSFADDTALVFSGETWDEVHKNATQGLQIVHSWFKNHILTLNLKKTNYMTFSPTETGNPPPEFQIKLHTHIVNNNEQVNCSCQSITKVKSTKYLGIMLDDHLKWNVHVQYLISKLKYLTHIFYKINKIKDLRVIRTIYSAYAHSLFQYGIEIWGGSYDTHFNQIFILQKHLIRAALGRPRLYPSARVFEELEVPTLRQIYVKKIILHINKNINNFEIKDNPYNTRSTTSNTYNILFSKLTVCKRQFSYYSCVFANKVPNHFISQKITHKLIKEIDEWVKINVYFKLPHS